jgi:Flp pilus assembly pilin Flp
MNMSAHWRNTLSALRSTTRSFARSQTGASAVEFALIAPFLLVVLLGIAEVGWMTYQRTDMHGAVRSGAQYVMNGGRDLDTAESIVQRSWGSISQDGMIEATRFCLCATAEHICSAPCDDDSVPEAYIRLRAHATLGGVFVEYGASADDAVRIR